MRAVKRFAIVCALFAASGIQSIAFAEGQTPTEPAKTTTASAPPDAQSSVAAPDAPETDAPEQDAPLAPKPEAPPETPKGDTPGAPQRNGPPAKSDAVQPGGPEAPLEPPKKAERKLIQWSSFDFQYLYGANWKLGAKKKDILTLEHADGWRFGDNYLFVDVSHLANQDDPTSEYGEWQPRFSVSKLIGESWGFGDILETNRIAFGGGFLAHLDGIAVDLNLPGFAYFHQHAFLRNDIHLKGFTWQLTTEWSIPILLGPIRLVQDGFAHFIGKEGTANFNIITQPQLLLDLGNFGGYEDQFFIGTEVDIRYNEYGIKGKNELVPQAMVEWKL
jgi:nucleoside-specific outer membrane channel protein Tsx